MWFSVILRTPHRKIVLLTPESCNAYLKENPELAHNKDCFLKKLKFSLYMHYACHLFTFILLDAVKGKKNRFAAEQLTLLSPFCPEMNVCVLFSRSL